MPNKSRFIIAESNIKAFFRDDIRKVYSTEQLDRVLIQNRTVWNLPSYLNTNQFIERLLKTEILSEQEIQFENGLIKKRYATGEASVFQLAVSLMGKSYLSHYSAVFLHGLTNQIPKTIYISFEQSLKNKTKGTLQQHAVDSAFSKPQRKSNAVARYREYTLLLHNGMYSNRTGVSAVNELPVTNLERTLIDIAVRPNYAGGVYSVLDIYRRVIDKISVNKLSAILEKLDFIYPYQQAVGFYLERAGLKTERLNALKERVTHLDFYLTYEMKETEYDKDWKIYYPKGM